MSNDHLTCKVCESTYTKAKRPARYDGEPTVCRRCSLAEKFVNAKGNACVLHGGTPKKCGVPIDEWRILVADTRLRTTDRMFKEE